MKINISTYAFLAVLVFSTRGVSAQPVAAPVVTIEEEETELEVPAHAVPVASDPEAGTTAVAPESATSAPPPSPGPDQARLLELEARIAALADQLAVVQTASASKPTDADTGPVKPELAVGVRAGETGSEILGGLWTPGLLVSGFVQSQFDRSQLSEDQLQQGGEYLNQDQFSIRRARLRLDRRWHYGAGALELDGSTIRGIDVVVRRAEGTLLLPSRADGSGPPLVSFTMGISEVPFGRELTEPTRTRLFMERSLASMALFPNEPDLGARLAGAISHFRYAVGVFNGEPIANLPGRPFRGDPNAAKDIVGRIGADTKKTDLPVRIAGGVSVLHGTGMAFGRDATKNAVEWRDWDHNTIIGGLIEFVPLPGTAAVASQNFRRWALGVDLDLSHSGRWGLSRFFAEAVVANNLDRGLFVANPVANGVDVRHFGWNVGVYHVLDGYGLAGIRVDAYNPNADLLDSRAGKLLPVNQTITTVSPLVGVLLGNRLRLLAQYDFIDDNLGRDDRGVPTNLRNNRFSIRLQADL